VGIYVCVGEGGGVHKRNWACFQIYPGVKFVQIVSERASCLTKGRTFVTGCKPPHLAFCSFTLPHPP